MSNTQPFSLLRPNFFTDAQTYATIMSTLLRIAMLVGGASDIEFLLRHGQPASIDISLLDLALQVNDIKKIEALLIYGDRFFNREIRQKALMNTVDSDCEGIVKSLLEPSIGNVDPNFWTPSSTSKLYTPLHSAVLNQSFNIVCLLLRHGANPNAQNSSGTSPLHLVGDSSPHIAQYLIKCGAFIDIQDNDGHSPLHSISDLEIAKKFLGADPNIADCKNGATALHAMLDTGDMELVTWVCKEAGANPTPPCDVPPFEHAFRNGMYPTPLIALGLDPWQRNKDGETIAHSSLTMSHSNEDDYFQSIFLAELLDHDPSLIHARDYSENTPLHIAAAKCFPSVILSLVNMYGADMTAVNRYGFAPLTQAVVFQKDATTIQCVLELMKDRGLGVDSSTDNHGWTALHHAAFHRNNTAVRLLIKHGANCNAVNDLGRRPLHLCGYVFYRGRNFYSYGDHDVSRVLKNGPGWQAAKSLLGRGCTTSLIRSGADATLCDNDGNLPFFLAAASFRVTETFWMVRAAASGGLFKTLKRVSHSKKRKGGRPSSDCRKRLKQESTQCA